MWKRYADNKRLNTTDRESTKYGALACVGISSLWTVEIVDDNVKMMKLN